MRTLFHISSIRCSIFLSIFLSKAQFKCPFLYGALFSLAFCISTFGRNCNSHFVPTIFCPYLRLSMWCCFPAKCLQPYLWCKVKFPEALKVTGLVPTICRRRLLTFAIFRAFLVSISGRKYTHVLSVLGGCSATSAMKPSRLGRSSVSGLPWLGGCPGILTPLWKGEAQWVGRDLFPEAGHRPSFSSPSCWEERLASHSVGLPNLNVLNHLQVAVINCP